MDDDSGSDYGPCTTLGRKEQSALRLVRITCERARLKSKNVWRAVKGLDLRAREQNLTRFLCS